jgi:dienelactone hydrolase
MNWRALLVLAVVALSAGAARAAPAPGVVEANPVVLAAPGRGLDLSLRITFPSRGRNLPVVLFSHGAAFSKDDYAPLPDFWAANGFVVIQPTHLDAEVLHIPAGDPRLAEVWRSRIEDLKLILDRLDRLEATTPGLAGRIDRRRIVVAGHSYGGHTAEALLGARPMGIDFTDARVTAGLLLAPPGSGGDDLSPAWRDRRYLEVDWSPMRKPTLVVVGDKDDARLMTVRDWDWRADAYRLAPPGGKCLLTVAGAGHYLGGIDGGRRPTLAGDAERLAAVKRLTLAYLKSAVDPRDPAWARERRSLHPGDRLACK